MRTFANIVQGKKVRLQLDNQIKYVLRAYGDDFYANRLLSDYYATLNDLYLTADVWSLLDEPRLRKLGYRRAFFKHYRHMIIVYWIEGDIVYIEGVYDDRRDYFRLIG